MKLEGTKTEKNLWEAFAAESQARVKYEYYASQAKKDGYEQMAEIFDETSKNEKEHAKIWFKLLYGGSVPTTIDNLLDAAQGENYEWSGMYKEYAQIAKEEGFEDIAKLFEKVSHIEREHELRYLALLDNIKNNRVFKKEETIKWTCRNCGYIHTGEEALDVCPVCVHPKAFFEKLKTNYI